MFQNERVKSMINPGQNQKKSITGEYVRRKDTSNLSIEIIVDADLRQWKDCPIREEGEHALCQDM